jgi:hypothetical protein
MVMAFALVLISCNSKPNDKLTIDGQKYTISLGEINLHDGFIDISVLADGKPMQNHTVNKTSSISMGGQIVSSSSSIEQPVKMGLTVNGRYIFPSDMLSSDEDGKFVFYVDNMPEIIQVFTDFKVSNTVYFNADTKEVIAPPVVKLEKEQVISGQTLSQTAENPDPSEKKYLKFLLVKEIKSFSILVAAQDGQITGSQTWQAGWSKMRYNGREVLEVNYYEDTAENISGVYLAFEKDKILQEGQKMPSDGILLLPEKLYSYTVEPTDGKDVMGGIVISIFE